MRIDKDDNTIVDTGSLLRDCIPLVSTVTNVKKIWDKCTNQMDHQVTLERERYYTRLEHTSIPRLILLAIPGVNIIAGLFAGLWDMFHSKKIPDKLEIDFKKENLKENQEKAIALYPGCPSDPNLMIQAMQTEPKKAYYLTFLFSTYPSMHNIDVIKEAARLTNLSYSSQERKEKIAVIEEAIPRNIYNQLYEEEEKSQGSGNRRDSIDAIELTEYLAEEEFNDDDVPPPPTQPRTSNYEIKPSRSKTPPPPSEADSEDSIPPPPPPRNTPPPPLTRKPTIPLPKPPENGQAPEQKENDTEGPENQGR